MKKETQLLREGFFYSEREYELPVVAHSHEPWFGQVEFLNALSKTEIKLNPLRYKGYSTCRCCGQSNGSTEFRKDGWAWPEGLAHYVRHHNYRPSLAFQEFILGRKLGA